MISYMENMQEETQMKQLKKILKEYGINNTKELDKALSKAMESINIGIMTDCIVEENNRMKE